MEIYPERVKQGLLRPVRARNFGRRRRPRALPWADVLRPLRGEEGTTISSRATESAEAPCSVNVELSPVQPRSPDLEGRPYLMGGLCPLLPSARDKVLHQGLDEPAKLDGWADQSGPVPPAPWVAYDPMSEPNLRFQVNQGFASVPDRLPQVGL